MPHLNLSPPRKRGSRASDGAVLLDPRFRGGDSAIVSRDMNTYLAPAALTQTCNIRGVPLLSRCRGRAGGMVARAPVGLYQHAVKRSGEIVPSCPRSTRSWRARAG